VLIQFFSTVLQICKIIQQFWLQFNNRDSKTQRPKFLYRLFFCTTVEDKGLWLI